MYVCVCAHACVYNTHPNSFSQTSSLDMIGSTSIKQLPQRAKERETKALVLRPKQATERVLGTDSY